MFDVEWSQEALDQLADIFTTTGLDVQDRMTAAIESLNYRFGQRPHHEGESRNGNARIVFVDLLAVTFWVEDAARLVRVNTVQRYGR